MTVVPGHGRQPGQEGHDPGHVVAGLAGGLGVAEHQILDQRRVELGHLGQDGPDDLGGHVVGAEADEGALEGPADRAAGGGDDDGLGHGSSSIGRAHM